MHPKKKRSEMAMGLDSFPGLALDLILSKLDAEDIARVVCVSKTLRDLATREALSSRICFQDLGLMNPVNPFGKPTLSFKVAYQIWREAFRMYPWCLVKRVGKCWDRIKTWLTSNFPKDAATLKKGASEIALQKLEKTLDAKLPLDVRVLYRFHDGQNIRVNSYLGLIGGYSLFAHKVNTYILPLRKVISETQRLIHRHLLPSIFSKHVVVAASCIPSYSGKWILLNPTNGRLYVWGRCLAEGFPCVPHALTRDSDQNHAMLLWLEEHDRRLQSGIIKLLVEDNIRSINLCEEDGTLFATGVSNNVQYPILDSSGREYAFQGRIEQWTTSSSIGGSFTFVPGRLSDPKGNPFQVSVLFPTQVPDYVF